MLASFLDKHFKNTSASFPRKLSHETTEGVKRLLYIIKENAKYQTNTTDETKVTNNNINLLVPDPINQTDKKHIGTCTLYHKPNRPNKTYAQ